MGVHLIEGFDAFGAGDVAAAAIGCPVSMALNPANDDSAVRKNATCVSAIAR